VKLDFTGAYSVIARNVHGEAKAVISLQVYVHGKRELFFLYSHPSIHLPIRQHAKNVHPLGFIGRLCRLE
jgi:hypothetical protein